MNRLAWLALLAFACSSHEDPAGARCRQLGGSVDCCSSSVLPSLLTGPRIRLRQPSLFLLVMTLFTPGQPSAGCGR